MISYKGGNVNSETENSFIYKHNNNKKKHDWFSLEHYSFPSAIRIVFYRNIIEVQIIYFDIRSSYFRYRLMVFSELISINRSSLISTEKTMQFVNLYTLIKY